MDKLLDKEVHQLYKAPSLSTYLSTSAIANMAAANRAAALSKQMAATASLMPTSMPNEAADGTNTPLAGQPQQRKSPSSGCESDDSMRVQEKKSAVPPAAGGEIPLMSMPHSGAASGTWQIPSTESHAQSLEYLNLEQKFTSLTLDGATNAGGARPKTMHHTRYYGR